MLDPITLPSMFPSWNCGLDGLADPDHCDVSDGPSSFVLFRICSLITSQALYSVFFSCVTKFPVNLLLMMLLRLLDSLLFFPELLI